MNATQAPEQQEGFERKMARSGESAMFAGLMHHDNSAANRATDSRVDSSRASVMRGEVADIASGEDVRIESQQNNRVNATEIRHRLETQLEQFLKIQDASEAERLAAEITGKPIESTSENTASNRPSEAGEEANPLSQQERLKQAQEEIQKFIDELTKALVRILSEQPDSIKVAERDSINYKTTRQLGEPGALNFVVADKAVANKVIETFKELHVDLSGYQSAHKQLEGGVMTGQRDGFVLTNELTGLRLMFLLQRDIDPNTATPEQVAESNAKIDEKSKPVEAKEEEELPMQTGTTTENIGSAVSMEDLQKRRNEQTPEQPSPSRGLFDV